MHVKPLYTMFSIRPSYKQYHMSFTLTRPAMIGEPYYSRGMLNMYRHKYLTSTYLFYACACVHIHKLCAAIQEYRYMFCRPTKDVDVHVQNWIYMYKNASIFLWTRWESIIKLKYMLIILNIFYNKMVTRGSNISLGEWGSQYHWNKKRKGGKGWGASGGEETG